MREGQEPTGGGHVRHIQCAEAHLGSAKRVVKRMRVLHTMRSHRGCVNTAVWNEDGTKVISGSDDSHLNVWNPFTGKLLARWNPGHSRNIFCGRFLPFSNDTEVVSCAADTRVIQSFLCETGDEITPKIYHCHRDMVYKIAVTQSEPNVFLTCSEDGTIRTYDRRVDHTCGVRGCKDNILVKSRRSGLLLSWAISSIAMHPTSPHYLISGGVGSSVQLWDRRKSFTSNSSDPVRIYRSSDEPSTISNIEAHITSVAFSQSGQELLASYSGAGVCLFDFSGDKAVVLPQPEIGSVSESSPSRGSSEVPNSPDEGGSAEGSGAANHAPDRQTRWEERSVSSDEENGASPVGAVFEAEDILDDVIGDSASDESDESDDVGPPGYRALLLRCLARASASRRLEEARNARCERVLPSREFEGHQNRRTVKECSFFGSKYIASGSDDGYAFIWEKATGELVHLLHADPRIVNCVQGHPKGLPVMVTSGLANYVRVWMPSSSDVLHGLSGDARKRKRGDDHDVSDCEVFDNEDMIAFFNNQ